MLPDQTILRIPGPSPVPPRVQQAMNRPMIGHRSDDTKALLNRIKPKLKPLFGTNSDVQIINGSGTAGLEAAVVNTLKAGDDVLVVVTGAFGERFVQICETHKINVHRLDIPWGHHATPEQLSTLLDKLPPVQAVFMTYCETSTGVMNPVRALAAAARHSSDALVIVDGVSCIGATQTQMDDWGIDVMVAGSQKALMLPPGLTFIAASERAQKQFTEETSAFYLNLATYQDKLLDNQTPFTPAISLLFGLDTALDMMAEEGMDQVYKRHNLMMAMTRAAFQALDIPLLVSDEAASPTITSIMPDDFAADNLRRVVKQHFGLELAGGQQHLKESIFRIGHMGYCSPADILQYISIIEVGLKSLRQSVKPGAGTHAAQEVYLKWGDPKA